MDALLRSVLRYENSSMYEKTEAAISLRRFKRSEEYKEKLKHAIRQAPTDERRASSDLEKRRIRLRAMEAQIELSDLLGGGEPRAFSGYVALRIHP